MIIILKETKKPENSKIKFMQEEEITKNVESWCHNSVPNSRNEKGEIYQRVFFLHHFLSGLPRKTSAPTQPGNIRIFLLARKLEVWEK